MPEYTYEIKPVRSENEINIKIFENKAILIEMNWDVGDAIPLYHDLRKAIKKVKR